MANKADFSDHYLTTISKREAKRLACLITGEWLLQTDTDGLSDETPHSVRSAVQEAQKELALELIRRGQNAHPLLPERN